MALVNESLKACLGIFLLSPLWVTYAGPPAGVKLHSKQHININVGPAPTSLDPAKSTSAVESKVIEELFDGLVNYTGKGGIEPGLATEWKQTGPRTWKFTLRKAQFSNKTPITAQDVVESVQRVFDPATASPYAGVFYDFFDNAEAVNTGRMPPQSLGIAAADKGAAVVVTTPFPVAILPEIMAHTTFRIVPMQVVKAHKDKWVRAENIVSSGPFVLESQTLNSMIVLKKNPLYWGHKDVVLEKVVFHTVESQNTEWKMYQNNQLDITNEVNPNLVETLATQRPLELRQSPRLMTYFYSLQHKDPLLKNKDIRRALSLAVDRKTLAMAIPNSQPSFSFMASRVFGAPALAYSWEKTPMEQRLEEAKALVKKAGVKPGTRLAITIHNDEVHKKVALIVAQQWRQLGFSTVLDTQEFKAVLQRKQLGNFQAARTSWLADYNWALTFANQFSCTMKSTADGYCNPAYDSLVKEASQEPDTSKASQLFEKAQTLLMDDYPAVPLLEMSTSRLVKTHVGGYNNDSPLDRHPAKELYILAL